MKRHELITAVSGIITFCLLISLMFNMNNADVTVIDNEKATLVERTDARYYFTITENLVISSFVFALLTGLSFLLLNKIPMMDKPFM